MQVPVKERQKSKLYIYTGIHDGYTVSVPISESLNFYNKVVSDFDSSPGSALIPQEDIIEILSSRHYEANNKDTLGGRTVHYSKRYKDLVEITVFGGSHECLNEIARHNKISLKTLDINITEAFKLLREKAKELK